MGNALKSDLKERLGREQGLEIHLQANFYPPLPSYVQQSIITVFKEHWDGECDDHHEITERCYLRNVDALYRYFDEFLNESDEL